jgi:transposase-like protein
MIAKNQFKSIIDLVNQFPTDKSCHHYLVGQRWGGGYMECPYDDCNGDTPYVFKDGIRYKCKCCQRIYTAKTGTIFEASKLPMIKWFVAIYLVMHKKGISSIQLSKDVAVTQKTAWFMLHRIRKVLGNNEDEILEGTIQLDETFVGGKNKNRHWDKKVKNSQGRSFKDKTPVMGMLQQNVYEFIERPNKVQPEKTVVERIIVKPSVIKCRVIENTKGEVLQPIIKANVLAGSIVVSDEWWAYQGLNSTYNHQIVDHAHGQYVNATGHTSNALEGGWSHLKRSIFGIYHKVSKNHLDKYVDEFVFKHNYRTFDVREQINVMLNQSECRLKLKDLKNIPNGQYPKRTQG